MAEQLPNPSDKSAAFSEKLQTFWQRLRTGTAHSATAIKNWLSQSDNRKKLLKWSIIAAGAAFLSGCLLALLVYLGAFGKLPNYTDLKAIRNYMPMIRFN